MSQTLVRQQITFNTIPSAIDVYVALASGTVRRYTYGISPEITAVSNKTYAIEFPWSGPWRAMRWIAPPNDPRETPYGGTGMSLIAAAPPSGRLSASLLADSDLDSSATATSLSHGAAIVDSAFAVLVTISVPSVNHVGASAIIDTDLDATIDSVARERASALVPSEFAVFADGRVAKLPVIVRSSSAQPGYLTPGYALAGAAVGAAPVHLPTQVGLTVDSDFDVSVSVSNPSSYVAEVLLDLPVIYWRLDEQSGNEAFDWSSIGNLGSYINAPTLAQTGATADGDTAIACSSSGIAPYAAAQLATPINLPAGSADCTIELLFRSVNSSGAAIMPASGSWALLFYGTALSGQARIISIAPTGIQVATWGNANLWTWTNDARWHHLVVTMSAHSGLPVYTLYIDGQQLGTSFAAAAGTMNTIIGQLLVGGNTVSTAQYPGKIDEVAIYPGILSAQRIAAHASAVGLASGTVAYGVGDYGSGDWGGLATPGGIPGTGITPGPTPSGTAFPLSASGLHLIRVNADVPASGAVDYNKLDYIWGARPNGTSSSDADLIARAKAQNAYIVGGVYVEHYIPWSRDGGSWAIHPASWYVDPAQGNHPDWVLYNGPTTNGVTNFKTTNDIAYFARDTTFPLLDITNYDGSHTYGTYSTTYSNAVDFALSTSGNVQKYMFDNWINRWMNDGYHGISWDNNPTSENSDTKPSQGHFDLAGNFIYQWPPIWAANTIGPGTFTGDATHAQIEANSRMRATFKAAFPNGSWTANMGYNTGHESYSSWSAAAAYFDSILDETGFNNGGVKGASGGIGVSTWFTFHLNTSQSNNTPGTNQWLDRMSRLTAWQNANPGKMYAVINSVWYTVQTDASLNGVPSTGTGAGTVTAANIKADIQWMLANYFMVMQSHTYILFGGPGSTWYGGAVKWQREFDAVGVTNASVDRNNAVVTGIGSPVEDFDTTASIYQSGTHPIYGRHFTNGLVLINPDGTMSDGSVSVSNLPTGTYKDLYGANVDTVSLGPGSAIVLLKR